MALEKDPECRLAYYRRGDAYAAKGEDDKAIVDLTKAIDMDANLAEAFYLRGSIYKDEGEKSKSEADFKKAKELGFPDLD